MRPNKTQRDKVKVDENEHTALRKAADCVTPPPPPQAGLRTTLVPVAKGEGLTACGRTGEGHRHGCQKV